MSSGPLPGRTDRASLEIDARPEAIYAAFADAATLVTWLPPGGMTSHVLDDDFREGGRYRIALTYPEPGAGKTDERTDVSGGRFLVLEPGRRIVWTVEFESADPAFAGEMRMTWQFDPVGSRTRVTIIAEGVPAGIRPEDHDDGLRASLANLAGFVA